MAQQLSARTQRRLAFLIHQAMQYQRTNNDLDAFNAAQSIVQLSLEFGIDLPTLAHAKAERDRMNRRRTSETIDQVVANIAKSLQGA